MKKALVFLLVSILVLAACSNGNSKDDSNKVNENKVQYKNDTVVLDQAVLYIKDAFIINNTDNNTREIAFQYEVKNKTDKEEITPGNVFMVAVNVKQDNGNTVDQLNTGATILPNGKYKEWAEHEHDTIKKGKVAKGMSGYVLKNDEKVILEFTKGMGGKKLGTKEYDLSKLKTVDYSTEEDSNNTIQESNSNVEEQQTAEISNVENDVQATADTSKPVEDKRIASSEPIQPQQQESEAIKEEKQPQGGIGGHPALADPSIPAPSYDDVKIDENGDEYYDSTQMFK